MKDPGVVRQRAFYQISLQQFVTLAVLVILGVARLGA